MFFHHNVKILPFIGTNNVSFLFITSVGIVAGESVAEIDDVCGGAGFALGGHNWTNVVQHNKKIRIQ
jgi:hypothetical protein